VKLILVGLNHKTAPVEVRECLARPEEQLPSELAGVLSLAGVREALLLSTCNRVELLAAAEDHPGDAAGRLAGWLVQGREIDPQQALSCLYTHQDQEAVRHLFRVASSLDSLVLGEPQILGQIKQAYRGAAEAGATGPVLNRLLHKTFQVAKRVRSETSIGGAAVSVAFAAVQLGKRIFDRLEGLTALLVGAGEMAELAAEHLMANGVSRMLVANRTIARAVELARRFGGDSQAAFGLEELEAALAESDIVISSTGAGEPLITPELARRALRRRLGRPVFFIDIAVPRDVDPAVGRLDGCFVYDIDDLGQVVQRNRQARQKAALAAERIVAEEVLKFQHWLESLSVAPTIAALVKKAEDLRAAEVARTLKSLGGADPATARALEALTRSLVKKLLHDPIMFLKEQSHQKSASTRREQIALVQRIFRLGPNDGGPDGDD